MFSSALKGTVSGLAIVSSLRGLLQISAYYLLTARDCVDARLVTNACGGSGCVPRASMNERHK
jgi:hypothetical protein